MRAGRSRAAWDPNRSHKVRMHSFWRLLHPEGDAQVAERWKVTELFKFETGPGEILAVRIRCFDGSSTMRVRRMSEARFLQLFTEVQR